MHAHEGLACSDEVVEDYDVAMRRDVVRSENSADAMLGWSESAILEERQPKLLSDGYADQRGEITFFVTTLRSGDDCEIVCGEETADD